MKTTYSTLCRISLAFLLGTVLGTPTASAQHPQTLARATVPFAFQYGSRTFPAGKYSFGMIADNIMVVRGPSKSALSLVNWSDAKSSDTGRLVFHREGERLVLQDIWVPYLSAHVHCPIAKQPKRREVATTKPVSEEVELALLEGAH